MSQFPKTSALVVSVGRRYKIVPLLWFEPIGSDDYVWQLELLG